MTPNDQLALLELDAVWEPGLPLAPGTIDPADQQQLIWGYPGLPWGAPRPVRPADTLTLVGSASGTLTGVGTYTRDRPLTGSARRTLSV